MQSTPLCPADCDESDIDIDYFGYNPATDQMLNNIDLDDQEEAARFFWASACDPEHTLAPPIMNAAFSKKAACIHVRPCGCRFGVDHEISMLSLAGVQEEASAA